MAESQFFQSLLQLAVGLNVGFVAIATVYGTSISKERSKIEELSMSTSLYRNHCLESRESMDKSAEMLKSIMRLRQDLKREVSDLERFVDKYCRPTALFASFLAFIFLIYASFEPSSDEGALVPLIAIGVNTPLILFFAYAYFRSVTVLSQFARRRQDLDDRLTECLAGIS